METLFKAFLGILGLFNGNMFRGYEVDIPVVKYGDGLYKEANNVYVYKGENPNNYIYFNDEMWRIISLSKDHIKIIQERSINIMPFDLTKLTPYSGSSLARYLNSYYYDNLDTTAKSLIVPYNFDGLATLNVGILSMPEYLQASSLVKKCGNLDSYFNNVPLCVNIGNYINNLDYFGLFHTGWTLTKDNSLYNSIYYFGDVFYSQIYTFDMAHDVFPVVYLKPNIKLEGKGTARHPYIINTAD